MHAAWIWCIAKIIAVDAQCWPRASHSIATCATSRPMPPYSTGTYAESSFSSRSAANASRGKRASRSTASAFAATISRPILCARSRIGSKPGAAGWIALRARMLVMGSLRQGLRTRMLARGRRGARRSAQLRDRLGERADRAERLAAQHAVEELHVEVLLEREHEVHGGKRGESRLVEVGLVGELIHAHRQAAVLGEDRSDLFGVHVVVV